MSETDTQLLQQIVDLLRESAEYRRKSIGEAVDSLKNQPDDWKKNREESMRRMAEATARSEERRREDQQHQAAVLAELKTITSLLLSSRNGFAIKRKGCASSTFVRVRRSTGRSFQRQKPSISTR